MNPESLFELLKEADVLGNSYYIDVMQAFLEVRGFDEFERLVNSYGSRWSDDINIYRNFDWEDYGREMLEICGYEIPEPLEDFIDFEAYGKYIGEYVEEYSCGLIEILR